MSTIISLVALWFGKRAERRMQSLLHAERVQAARDQKRAAQQFNRKPDSSRDVAPMTIQGYAEAIRHEEAILAQTRARIARNQRFFDSVRR